MTECSAAMLLMKLSCSPHSNPLAMSFISGTGHSGSLPSYPNMPSPVDSSGASSFRSATPSPPLSSSTGTSTADEGIVKDLFSSEQMRSRSYKPVSYLLTYSKQKKQQQKLRAKYQILQDELLFKTQLFWVKILPV